MLGDNRYAGMRILVCDDEPSLLRLVALNFERLGFEVLTARDGREALDLVLTEPLSACILDVMMPHIDGLEVLRRIRLNPSKENLFVAMLTVKAQDEEVADAYRNGADLYLTKPFSVDDIEKCAELISQHSP